MIEIEIFEDIKDQPAKLIGPFTTRQTICAVVAGGLCFLAYKFSTALFGKGNSYTVLLIILACIIPVLIGWIKPYGLPFEKFAVNMLYTYLLPPKKRLYCAKNIYEEFEDLIIAEEKAAEIEANGGKSASAKKKNPKKQPKNKQKDKEGNSE